jgi:hypothetical protein
MFSVSPGKGCAFLRVRGAERGFGAGTGMLADVINSRSCIFLNAFANRFASGYE